MYKNKETGENGCRLADYDRGLIEEYRGDIRSLLYDIENDHHCSYRELSIVKTKLEECEMWLDKLIEGEVNNE